MTVSNRWLLPDGVEDILPPQATTIERLRRDLLDTWQRWGYQLIMPPLIEYLESLLTGTGTDLALQTFKLTDQQSGRLMGVRADTTPQAARIDARSMQGRGTNRLCYAGHVLHTRAPHSLAGRTPLQAGCELFGSAALAADHEVIRLMLESLQVAGMPHIHLDLAHVTIYQQLIAQVDVDADTEAAIFDAFRRKSVPELDDLLGHAARGSAGQMLRALARLCGGREVIDEARSILQGAPEAVHLALVDLEQTADRLVQAFPALELGFDFCELRGYNYHTGLVFGAYVPGENQVVAQGGRYDAVGRDFGQARPATGFSLDLRLLGTLQSSGRAAGPGPIWAPQDEDPALAARIAELRQHDTVIQSLPGDAQDPRAAGCDRQLIKRQDGWQVDSL